MNISPSKSAEVSQHRTLCPFKLTVLLQEALQHVSLLHREDAAAPVTRSAQCFSETFRDGYITFCYLWKKRLVRNNFDIKEGHFLVLIC